MRALQRKQPLTTEGIIEAANATVPLSISRREDIERVRSVGARFTPVR